jgi:hypothetical protein
MRPPRLCQYCKSLQFGDLIKDLDNSLYGRIHLDDLPRDKFRECVTLCDICAITGACFEKEIGVMDEHSSYGDIGISVLKRNDTYWLMFTDRALVKGVDWIIHDNNGTSQLLLFIFGRCCGRKRACSDQ